MHTIPSEQLKNWVAGGRISQIRQALQAELNDNSLSDEYIINAIKWVTECTSSLFEDHAPEQNSLRQDSATWDEDYFLDQKVEINYNFSRERFEHLVAIRKHLREQGHPNFICDVPKNKTETTHPTPDENARPQVSQPQSKDKFRESDSSVPLIVTIATGTALAISKRGVIAGTIGVTIAIGVGYLLFKKFMR